ncbi:MAG: cysteine desulfurase family protein [Acidimicrobiales bacterium]
MATTTASPSPAEVPANRHYLDHASTTPLRPEAAQAMARWLAQAGPRHGVGDPGRLHAEGQRARVEVETARETVAAFLGAEPSRVIFTASATEAANAAIFGAAALRPGAPLLCAAVEHSCVRQACLRAGPVVQVPVDGTGCLIVDELGTLLEERHDRGQPPAIVNCQLANHEVGTVQPVAEVVALCGQARVPVHCDAAAAAGHVPVSFRDLGVDLLSVSSHKLGGPPGVGALLVRRGLRLAPFIVGGSEERARRAGAENVLGIVGFAAACAALTAERLAREAGSARRRLAQLDAAAASVRDVGVIGDAAGRLPHVLCVTVGGVVAEAVLLALDRAGIAAHSGSACSSEVFEPSPVLAAIGAPADRSLRLSVGWTTTDEDVSAFARVFGDTVERLRSLAGPDPTPGARTEVPPRS